MRDLGIKSLNVLGLELAGSAAWSGRWIERGALTFASEDVDPDRVTQKLRDFAWRQISKCVFGRPPDEPGAVHGTFDSIGSSTFKGECCDD